MAQVKESSRHEPPPPAPVSQGADLNRSIRGSSLPLSATCNASCLDAECSVMQSAQPPLVPIDAAEATEDRHESCGAVGRRCCLPTRRSSTSRVGNCLDYLSTLRALCGCPLTAHTFGLPSCLPDSSLAPHWTSAPLRARAGGGTQGIPSRCCR